VKKLFENKKGWIPSNEYSFTLVIIVGIILILVLIGGIIFIFRGSFCPKCPEIPECPSQIDPSDIQSIFNQIIDTNIKLDSLNTQIGIYRESCEINVSSVKNDLSAISTEIQETNNFVNSINSKLEDNSFHINFNIVIGALFGSLFGSLISIGIYLIFKKKD